MAIGSKRGAALAIVVVVTAALLILSAALVSSASINLNYSQNSLQDRQAYLDAKSAIEFGKAYVLNNPSTGDFSVDFNRDDYTFSINKDKTANAIAAYDSAGKLLKATAKDKTLDRFKKLGYRFQFAEEESGFSSDFLFSGTNHGGTGIFNTDKDEFLLKTYKVVYPIVMNFTPRLDSTIDDFISPQMYFMGINSNTCLRIQNTGAVILDSDFIYFNHDITVRNYDYRNKLVLKSYNGNDIVVVYFNNSDLIIGEKTYHMNGYYTFKSGCDLLM